MNDQSKGDQPASELIYWVAIQPSRNSAPIVFGPYSETQANHNRAEWLRTFPPNSIISIVFRAETRDLAEQNVGYFIRW